MTTLNPTKTGNDARRRRSQRVILSLPVMVRTDGALPNKSFEEQTQTLVVNAHGALVTLSGAVEKGQSLLLINRATHEDRLCHVVYVGPAAGGKAQVALEFKVPSPDFWRIAFPPEDWTMPDQVPASAEDKR